MTKRKWTLKFVPEEDRMIPEDLEWEIYKDGHDAPIMGNVAYYPFVPDDISDVHLIAAAPDMYKTLEKWVDIAERHMADFVMKMDANRTADFMQGVRVTRAVLRKADGEAQ